VSREGNSTLCFAVENLSKSGYFQSTKKFTKKLLAILPLLQHGAHCNMLMPNGKSPLYSVVRLLEREERRGDQLFIMCIDELLKLLVKHGAMLLESSSQLGDNISRLTPNSGTLRALSTYDGKHEFIVDLFRAGTGLQLIAYCCNAAATWPRKAKSIYLCKAAVLAGYTPSAEELKELLSAAESNDVLKRLVKWLNEDRQQKGMPINLSCQCRVVIRRLLSAAVSYQTILPAIDKLPLPNDLKLYLQFDGKFSEVKKLKTTEINEKGSVVALQNLQLAAARNSVLDQLVKWLREDRQQVLSLHSQCHAVIGRQLSAPVGSHNMLQAIDTLPLPNILKLYLRF